MPHPFLSVIIPAYNEAKRLPLTLVDVDYHLAKMKFPSEIIVVDDGSTDTTADIATRFTELIPRLRVLKCGHLGKGGAVKIGMLAGKGDWRLQIDADNSVSVAEFQKILPLVSGLEPPDIVLASRGVMGAKILPPLPLRRQVVESFLNAAARLILRLKAKDFQIGFHCYSAEAAEKIFSLAKLNSWGYGAEALALARRLGFKVAEAPFFASHTERGSHVNSRAYLQMFADLAKIRWWLWRRQYE